MEFDITKNVIRTDNLKAFLARRRWQRCGQAIRALRRLKGGTLSNSSSTESLVQSGEPSPAGSPCASPSTARRVDLLQSSAKLNLLEEKLKQELTGGRLLFKHSESEQDKKFKSQVEEEVSQANVSKDSR